MLNRHGLPHLLRREGGSLSLPSAQPAETIAKTFLRSHATLFQVSESEVENLRLVIKDVTAQATFLVFNQTLDSLDVFNGQVKFALSRAGEVVQAGVADVVPGLKVNTSPRLSPAEALRVALDSIGVQPAAALAPVANANGKSTFRNPNGDRYSSITVELSIFPLTATSACLAYRIFLEADEQSWYEILIDAGSGSLLFRHNLYVHAGRAMVWTQSPMQGARELVVFPEGWLPANGAVTTGNNADAYIDSSLPADTPDPINDEFMQNGRAYSPGQVFDFPFGDGTAGSDPRNYQPASVTNLFYFLNAAHDYFYNLGFTEVAGNFQNDNFGRGGVGNDPVLGEAQYGGFTNNSSFAPTVEGLAPRMRLGLWTRGTATRTDDLDGAFDSQTVLHEYAHGVTTRLIGGGTSTSCLNGIQSGAIGEGWSDYFAISFSDNPVLGGYFSQNSTSGSRRQSYDSYNFTYEDLGNGSHGYEAHDDGEIWAATLWDLRKALGRDLADRLVVDGLKATPCKPSMTDARDGILSADQAGNSGANRATIWQVFAKHGLGYSAVGADGTLRTGTRYDAAHDQPADLQAGGNLAVTSNPLAITAGVGDAYVYQVSVSNPNGGALNFALTQGPAGMTVDPASGLVSWVASFTGQRVKITITGGSGSKVVHGYFLPVATVLNPGSPVTVAGPPGSVGYASFDVPDGAPVLQVTLRGGAGDADLLVTDPTGRPSYSMRMGSSETLSYASPEAGRWQVALDGYQTYSGVTLLAALVTPTLLSGDTTLSGLSGELSSETLYRLTVPPGTAALSISTSGGTGDVDLFLRNGKPALCQSSYLVSTYCSYDKSSAQSGNSEHITLANPAPGDWYLDLSARATFSGVTLVTSTHALAIVTAATLPSGTVGVPYCLTLAVSGGAGPYQWTVTSGAFPAGVFLLGPSSFRGTPRAAGSSTFTLQVTDAMGMSATRTFTITIDDSGSLPTFSPLSAASLIPGAALAPESIATITGTGRCLADSSAAASPEGPWPVELGGLSVKVSDSAGVEQLAPLWSVATEQINFLVPQGTSTGLATVTVLRGDQSVATGAVQIDPVAPGLFTMDSNGQGVPAGLAIRSRPDGSQSWQYVFPVGCPPGSCIATPIDLGPETDQVVLQLFGTGIRLRSALSAVSAALGGAEASVGYAGPVAGLPGLDQVNVNVPRSLAGHGEVDLVIRADGKASNVVKVNFQ